MCFAKIFSWFSRRETPAPTPIPEPVIDPDIPDDENPTKEPETPVVPEIKHPQILTLSWSLDDSENAANAAKFYSALDLRVTTADYPNGEEVEVTLQRKDGKPLTASSATVTVKGTVNNNEAVFKNVFKDTPLNITNSPDFCIKASAANGDVTSFVSHSRPLWADVYDGYPKVNAGTRYENDQPAGEVFESILGENYNQEIFTNACATRVSIALNHAKVTVRQDFRISHGPYKGGGIIASATNLKKWLSSSNIFGEADVIIRNPQSFNELATAIGTKRGIYVMESNDFNWATGHATLWYDGHALGHHDYYSHGKEICFWELR